MLPESNDTQQDDTQQDIPEDLSLDKELDAYVKAQQVGPEPIQELGQETREQEQQPLAQREEPEESQQQQTQVQDNRQEHDQEEHNQDPEDFDGEIPSQSLPPPLSQVTEVDTPCASKNQEQQQTGQPTEVYSAVVLKYPDPGDDSFVPAAPSPISEVQFPVNPPTRERPAKKKRKYVKKKPDVVAPPGEGSGENEGSSKNPGEDNSQETGMQLKPKRSKSTSHRDGERKNGDDGEKPRGQGPTSAKERIEAQLRQAVEEGMCRHQQYGCGLRS